MRMSNPVINRMRNTSGETYVKAATYSGVAWKAIYFAMLSLLSALVSYIFAMSSYETLYGMYIPAAVICPIVALVCALVSSFNPRATKVFGSIYTIFQGFSIGFISSVISYQYSGVVFSALLATFGTFGIMSLLYKFKLIRVSNKFSSFMLSALIGIFFVQLLMFVISLFSPAFSNLIYGNGFLSIAISCFMVLFATFMLLADFNNITMLVENGVDSTYEWTAAFSLVITLIWLYVEFLRLFSKIASRRN